MRRVRSKETSEQILSGKETVTIVPFRGAATKVKEKTIEVHKFITDPAHVRIAAGVTKSTGNYESMRIDVSVTLPCYKEQVDDTINHLSAYVAEKLDAEITEYLGELD